MTPRTNNKLQWRHNELQSQQKSPATRLFTQTFFFSGADQSKLESSADNVSIWWRLIMPYKNCDGYLDIRYGPNLFLCRCVSVGNSPTCSPHPFIYFSCSRFMHTANAICKLINPVRTPNIQWAQQWYEMFWSFLNYIESTMVGWVVSNEQLLSLYILPICLPIPGNYGLSQGGR